MSEMAVETRVAFFFISGLVWIRQDRSCPVKMNAQIFLVVVEVAKSDFLRCVGEVQI